MDTGKKPRHEDKWIHKAEREIMEAIGDESLDSGEREVRIRIAISKVVNSAQLYVHRLYRMTEEEIEKLEAEEEVI